MLFSPARRPSMLMTTRRRAGAASAALATVTACAAIAAAAPAAADVSAPAPASVVAVAPSAQDVNQAAVVDTSPSTEATEATEATAVASSPTPAPDAAQQKNDVVPEITPLPTTTAPGASARPRPAGTTVPTGTTAPASTTAPESAAPSVDVVAGRATAPVVTTQPVETWVDLGSSATFVAHASGTPAPNVQWQFRRWFEDPWTDIPGATSDSYTSPAASVDDVEPGYRAVFTNSAGSVATQAADLRVNQAPPAAGTPSAPRHVTAHQTAEGQVTITWSAPADQGASAITSYGAGYGTRRWGNGDTFPATTFTAVFKDIPDGDYTATVFASNDAGMGWRVVVPFSVGDLPTAPTHVKATRSGSTTTVAWGAPTHAGYSPVTGYEVLATSGDHRVTRTLSATARSVVLTGLASGVWHIDVSATNKVGTGPAATASLTVQSATPPTTTVPPTTTPVTPTPTTPRTTPVAVATARPAAPASAQPAAALSPTVPAAPPRAELARTGSNGSSQALLAMALLAIGVGCTVASRRLTTSAA